jgi:predicted transposase/invertase (TIGR01784 family)
MFGVGEFKQTKVYQEAKEEGREEGRKQGREEGKLELKLEAVPRLLVLGLSVEQVAKALGLAVETVQERSDH